MTYRLFFDWLRNRRASAVVESAIAISCLGLALGTICQIVENRLQEDLLERAAYAVTRATVLAAEPATSERELRESALAAIRSELGGMLDSERLLIEIDSYDNTCEMSRGDESKDEFARLGGRGNGLVAIRLSYARPDGTTSNRVEKIALGRNEPRGDDQEEVV